MIMEEILELELGKHLETESSLFKEAVIAKGMITSAADLANQLDRTIETIHRMITRQLLAADKADQVDILSSSRLVSPAEDTQM